MAEHEDLQDNQAYLTFQVGKEQFALHISMVSEILEFSEITEVPNSDHYMKGIINLRGNVLPVIGTSLKFGLMEIEPNLKTRIIVLEIQQDDEIVKVGAMVDQAKSVLNVNPDSILPPPSSEDHHNANYITGIIKENETFIMVIDAQKLFGKEQLEFTSEQIEL